MCIILPLEIDYGLTEQRITEIATHQIPATEMLAYTVPKEFQQIENPKKFMSTEFSADRILSEI